MTTTDFQPVTLVDLATAFGNDLVLMQEALFDEAFFPNLESLKSISSYLESGLFSNDILLPRRLCWAKSEVSIQVLLDFEKSKGFKIQITPLNLGWQAIYGEDLHQSAKIHMQFEQLTVPMTHTKED